MSGARVCSRCGTHVDERRAAWSSVCLSCGFPLPPPAGGATAPGTVDAPASASSAPPWWILGVLGVVALVGIAAGGAFFLGRGRASAPTSSRTVDDQAAASALATAGSTSSSGGGAASSTAGGAAAGAATDASAAAANGADAGAGAGAGASAADASTKVASGPLTPQELDKLEGNYRCSLDDQSAFRCRIANDVLEKLDGSQRFKGPIKRLSPGSFDFRGTFFCPFGDCTHEVIATFVRQEPGRFVGRFGPASGGPRTGEVVTLIKTR